MTPIHDNERMVRRVEIRSSILIKNQHFSESPKALLTQKSGRTTAENLQC